MHRTHRDLQCSDCCCCAFIHCIVKGTEDTNWYQLCITNNMYHNTTSALTVTFSEVGCVCVCVCVDSKVISCTLCNFLFPKLELDWSLKKKVGGGRWEAEVGVIETQTNTQSGSRAFLSSYSHFSQVKQHGLNSACPFARRPPQGVHSQSHDLQCHKSLHWMSGLGHLLFWGPWAGGGVLGGWGMGDC